MTSLGLRFPLILTLHSELYLALAHLQNGAALCWPYNFRTTAKRSGQLAPLPLTPLVSARRKPVPHSFVLDALESLSPTTRHMFGCVAIYIHEKIVLILRDKPSHSSDNGVWLVTTPEHHASLRRDFPTLRSIQLLGKKVTGWQVLPADSDHFEEAALYACELVLAGNPRIGKIPDSRKKNKKESKA